MLPGVNKPEAELLATARMVFPGYYAAAGAAEARAFDLFVLARAAVQACGWMRVARLSKEERIRREHLAGLLEILARSARDNILRSAAFGGLSDLEKRKIRRHGGLDP